MKASTHNEDEVRLKDVILQIREFKFYLIRGWKLIMFVAALFGGLGVFYALTKEATYEAKLNFVVENNANGSSLGQYADLASQFRFDFGGGGSPTFTESNILELLTSRRVVENALLSEVNIDGTQELLINYHIRFNNYKEKWAETMPELEDLHYTADRANFTLLQDSVLGVAWKNLKKDNIKVETGESNIVTITCVSKDPRFPKLLSEALVREVSKFYVYTQTAKARHTLDFIQNRADSVFVELKAAEKAYARHKDSNFGVMRAEGLLEEIRLKREVEILNVMYGEILKNLEISKVTLLNQKPLINIIDLPRYPLEIKRFSVMKGLVLFGFLGGLLASIYVVLMALIQSAIKED